MRTVEDLNFSGLKALVRVDFNVPLDDNGNVTDTTRIKRALPTLNKILDDGGSIILMSHMGRPKGERNMAFSLAQIETTLEKELGREVFVAKDAIGEDTTKMASALKPGEVLLLENLRFHPEEKAGDEGFAQKIATLGDVYVNDAFGTAHRAHASTSTIAKYFGLEEKCFGYLMGIEVKAAKHLLVNPPTPFTVITGGAKISDKIDIIDNLIGKATNILIGGGMAFTFIKALDGSIGNSLCEDDKIELALELLDKAKTAGTNIVLPVDAIVADAFSASANHKISPIYSIEENWMGLDIGPKSITLFNKIIEQSKSILWNGPMGVFEFNNFAQGTKSIAQAVANATAKGAYSLIGGGDSAAAVNQFGFQEKVSHISTGGGALLEMFEGKTLPGIAALT